MRVDPSVQDRAIDTRAIDQGLAGQHPSRLGRYTHQERAEGARKVIAESAFRGVPCRRAENHPAESDINRGGNSARDLHFPILSLARSMFFFAWVEADVVEM